MSTADPYADFQAPAASDAEASGDPYADYQSPAGASVGSSSADANPGTPPPDKPGMTPLAKAHLGSSVGDTVGNIASHAASLVTAPLHAVLDAPQNADEQSQEDANGHTGLVLDRMLGVTVSKNAVKDSAAKFKQGDSEGGMESAMDAIPVVGPWARNIENETRDKGAVAALAGLATDAVAPKAIGGAAGKVLGKATAPAAALDEVIPGDTVTPRQVFDDAKAHGVNLDRAQATASPAAVKGKLVSEHSLGGSGVFKQNANANIGALEKWAQDTQNSASKQPMSRVDFGNTVKDALAKHQQELSDSAGNIYKELDKRVAGVTPDTAPIADAAQRIMQNEGEYYARHPEMMDAGTKRTWGIVNRLANIGDTEESPAKTVTSPILDANGRPQTTEIPATKSSPDTWMDLHNLRTDLMNAYRSPDIAGSRAEGYLKQLAGATDNSMTGAGSQLSGSDLAKFRNANSLYSQMKETYDSPQHPFYHIVRSDGGLGTADTIHAMKPEMISQFTQAMDDSGNSGLKGQLQRQTISRLLDPNGDGKFDLKNLPSRVNNQNAEKLQSVLTPQQTNELQNLSRTSRLVHADSNTSGTAKVAQPVVEGMEALHGLGGAALHLMSGNIPAALTSAGRPIAEIGGMRMLSRYLTSPAKTAKAFEPGINPSSVAAKTAGNLQRNAVLGNQMSGNAQPDSSSQVAQTAQPTQSAQPQMPAQAAAPAQSGGGQQAVDMNAPPAQPAAPPQAPQPQQAPLPLSRTPAAQPIPQAPKPQQQSAVPPVNPQTRQPWKLGNTFSHNGRTLYVRKVDAQGPVFTTNPAMVGK